MIMREPIRTFHFSAACVIAGFVAVGLAAGAIAPDARAQSNGHQLEVFEPATQPPPDQVELEAQRKQAPPAPGTAAPSAEELVNEISRQRGGREKLEEARKGGRPAHALPSSDRAPPELAQLEQHKPPAPPRNVHPTVQELEQSVARQPGGREKLERARQGGRPDRPAPRSSSKPETWFAWVPQLVANANAQTLAPTTTLVSAPVLTVTPKVDASGRHAGLSASMPHGGGTLRVQLAIWGSIVTAEYPTSGLVHNSGYSISWGDRVVSSASRPYVTLTVHAPADGYYVVNTRANARSGVELRRWVQSGAPLINTFDATGTADRSALVYLLKGTHYFHWVFPGTSWNTIYSASVAPMS
jgi:hypothetical protein